MRTSRVTARRSALVTAAALAAGTLLLAGCSSSTPTADTPSTAPVPASSPAVQGPGIASSEATSTLRPDSPQRVDVETFSGVVGQPGVTVVDVRTPAEFAAGHLDGAVNIDVESADFATAIADLDPEGTYAVYCRSGNRSAVAVGQMAQAGITGTYDLDGGIVAWEAAGLPVVS